MENKDLYNAYLMHHGIKGQKWGIRRYQNPDGSYTEAGKKRRYGSVTVTEGKKNNSGDPDTVIVSNRNKYVEISKRSLTSYEKAVDDIALNIAASYYNVPVKTVEKTLQRDRYLIEGTNEIIDYYMEAKLSSLLDSYGIDKRTTSNQIKPKATETRKMTQDQAINKGYSDLRKKYPNFDKFSQDKQDQLWADYMNSSGLYKYI